MTTPTTNFSMAKPETSDPLDIDAHWNNNLVTADTELLNADSYRTGHAVEHWRTDASWVFDSGASYVSIEGTGMWTKEIGVGDSILLGSAAQDGTFQFLVPGIYFMKLHAEGTPFGTDPAEARLGIRFAQSILFDTIPGLEAITPYNTFGSFRDTSVECSATFKIYDTSNNPGQTWTFDTSDGFNFQGLWQCTSATQGSFNPFNTWLEVHLLQEQEI